MTWQGIYGDRCPTCNSFVDRAMQSPPPDPPVDDEQTRRDGRLTWRDMPLGERPTGAAARPEEPEKPEGVNLGGVGEAVTGAAAGLGVLELGKGIAELYAGLVGRALVPCIGNVDPAHIRTAIVQLENAMIAASEEYARAKIGGAPFVLERIAARAELRHQVATVEITHEEIAERMMLYWAERAQWI